MHSTFWTNTIWYIPLAILVFIQLIYTLSKTEKRRLTFAFFITVSGMTLNFETLILIFMKAYAYYPMIIKNSPNPFNDVLAGNLFSQFSISASTLLAVVLNLKYHWYLILAAVYGFIEEGFLALGVYKHNWYQTWMTVVMAPFSLWIAKKMYEKIIKGVKPVFYYAYIYFGLFTLYVVTLLWGLHLSGYVEFSKTVFKDPINSVYFLILAIFFIPPCILMMLLHFMRPAWYWKLLGVAALYAFYYACYKLHLVWIKEGWFLPVTTVTILWMHFSIFILDWLYGRPLKAS